MIEVTCLTCSATYRLKDELGGRKAKCKRCGNVISIPMNNSIGKKGNDECGPSDRAARSEFEQKNTTDADADTELREKPSSVELAGEMKFSDDDLVEHGIVHDKKSCPYCHAATSDDAILCIECGYHFEMRHVVKSSSGPANSTRTGSDARGLGACLELVKEDPLKIGVFAIFVVAIAAYKVATWPVKSELAAAEDYIQENTGHNVKVYVPYFAFKMPKSAAISGRLEFSVNTPHFSQTFGGSAKGSYDPATRTAAFGAKEGGVDLSWDANISCTVMLPSKLYNAVESGDSEQVAQILSAGTEDIDKMAGAQEVVSAWQTFDGGSTVSGSRGLLQAPLHLAASKGQLAIVEILLQHGANVNAKTSDGHTAVDIAKKAGHESIVQLLTKSNL